MEDMKDFEIENNRKQIKLLNEMYELTNEELEICNIVIQMTMSDEEFFEKRKKAWEIYLKREEDEKIDLIRKEEEKCKYVSIF